MNNHARHPLENYLRWPPCANDYHIKSVCDGQPLPHSFFYAPYDALNNANDKIVNIVWNGNTITNDLMEKIVCDVPANGNVFLGVTVWDVYTNGNILLGLTVWDVHTNGKVFLGLTMCNVHTNGNV